MERIGNRRIQTVHMLEGIMMNYPNVEILRKSGYKVRVYHGRCWRISSDKSSEVDYMSRREYDEFNHRVANLSYELLCKGGFTIVEITTPDGDDLSGKFNVPKDCSFNRKLGLKIATNRALKKGQE